MDTISVVRNSADGLTQEAWVFLFIGTNLVLHEFMRHKRQSKRHNFQLDKKYLRINARDSSLKKEQVPWPQDVLDEALETFTKAVKFVL
jgi:hypothetical protein